MNPEYAMWSKLRDRVTGFSGVVLAIAHHADGTIRYGITSEGLTDSGLPREMQWFDQGRLIAATPKRAGFCPITVKTHGVPEPTTGENE